MLYYVILEFKSDCEFASKIQLLFVDRSKSVFGWKHFQVKISLVVTRKSTSSIIRASWDCSTKKKNSKDKQKEYAVDVSLCDIHCHKSFIVVF